MRSKLRFLLGMIVISIFLSTMGCSKDAPEDIVSEMPKDFNFRLTYGTYGKQKIDTFSNTVVKDLVEDGSIEANISFTKEERKQNYTEMMKINIMGELVVENKNEKECYTSTPSLTTWDIQINGKTKSV